MTASARPQVPVFVISLARAADRRAKIAAHLSGLGLEHRIVDGVDGRTLPQTEQDELLAPGQRYHAGVIGCYLSHLHVYETLVKENIEVALVLEDDARLHPRVVPFLRGGIAAEGFDYCFLDSDDHNDRGPVYYDRDDVAQLADGIRAFRLSDGPQTLHAYLITRQAAAQRLQHALPIEKPIDLYDHLPYPIRFRAIVSPKLAWVSEYSLQSFTSDRHDDAGALSFAALRKSPLFYRVRDVLKLKGWRDRQRMSRAMQAGTLSSDRRWAPLPSGREVVF